MDLTESEDPGLNQIAEILDKHLASGPRSEADERKYQAIKKVICTRKLGSRTRRTSSYTMGMFRRYRDDPEFERPEDLEEDILRWNMPSQAHRQIRKRLLSLVEECAKCGGDRTDCLWQGLNLTKFDTAENLVKSMQDTIHSFMLISEAAKEKEDYRTALCAASAFSAARELYESKWKVLLKSVGQTTAHKVLVERMKPYGDITEHQFAELVERSKGGCDHEASDKLTTFHQKLSTAREAGGEGKQVKLCTYCGMSNHTAQNCRKKARKEREGEKREEAKQPKHP